MSAIRRVLTWQLVSRMVSGPIAVPFTDRTWLLMERGMTGATGNYYCGLHEFEDMAFILNVLRPGDLFVDIGANVGAYTILAAGHAGADVVAAEPVPKTFDGLRRNVRFNELDERVTLVNSGIGETETSLRFTSTRDTVNHVATKSDLDGDTIEVSVTTLDRVCSDQLPTCIKIDVEGFEKSVLDGGKKTLSSPSLMAVLMELNGSGMRYGVDDAAIHADMLGHGFTPYRYEPFSNQLHRLEDRNRTCGNTLYLRDAAWARDRLHSATTIALPWRKLRCEA
jgi:FkbM family methyltransferase